MIITSNQAGMSTFGAMVSIFILGMIGSAALYLSVVSESGKEANWISSMSSYIAEAGAEYAMKKYYDGNGTVSIVTPGKDFANGTFIIVEQGSSPNITVQIDGRFGTASKKISFKKPTEAKCLSFDTSTAQLTPNTKLKQVYFKKSCLATITIDKIKVSWTTNSGETMSDITFQGSSQNISPPRSSGDLIEITNYILSDSNQKEIIIDFNNDMNGKTFTIDFTMLDTTIVTTTWTDPL